MDTKNFTIGVLSTTATILLVGLMVIHTRPNPVFADGMSVSGGDYVLTVGANDETDEEFIFVIDTSANKIIAYRFDARRGQIEIVFGKDLAQLQDPSNQQSPVNQPRNRNRP